MTPTWYDLLGVEPDASAAEIRAAWKASIADLDPGDRRFRALNEAAEVLLDEDKRAAYDETLAPEAEDETPLAPPGETEAEPAAPSATDEKPDPRTASGPRVPAWLLAALALLVAAMVATAGYLASQPSDDSIADGTSEAQGAAERAVTTILSYDYRHLDDDQKASGALMTSDYRKQDFDPLFTQIKANAPDLKAIVKASVVASGVVRSGDGRVQILVFVDQATQRKDLTQPLTYRNQVVMTMVDEDGEWLVDDMDTKKLVG